MEESENHDGIRSNPKPLIKAKPRRPSWKNVMVMLGLLAIAVTGLVTITGVFEGFIYYISLPRVSRAEFTEIKEQAHAGDAVSQLYYGIFHANGDGVLQNYAKAAEWYRKAAEKGNARAQRNLAVLYDCGLGVERDYSEALKWYLKAAEQDDAAAFIGISGLIAAYRRSIIPEWWGRPSLWMIKGTSIAWREFLRKENLPLNAGIKHYKSLVETAELSRPVPWGFWEIYRSGERFYQSDHLIVAAVKKMAEKNDAEAQLRMAIFHMHGQGFKMGFLNLSENVNYWLNRSIENGGNRAKFILAVNRDLISVGHSNDRFFLTDHDRKTKERWLSEAANSKIEPYFQYYCCYKKTFPGSSFNDNSCDDVFTTLAASGQPDAIYRVVNEENFVQYSSYLDQYGRDGDVESLFALFRHYFNSNSTMENLNQAKVFARKMFLSPDMSYLRITGNRSDFSMYINLEMLASSSLRSMVEDDSKTDPISQIILAIFKLENNRLSEATELLQKSLSEKMGFSYYCLGRIFHEQGLILFGDYRQLTKLTCTYGLLLEPREIEVILYQMGWKLGYLPALYNLCDLVKSSALFGPEHYEMLNLMLSSKDWYTLLPLQVNFRDGGVYQGYYFCFHLLYL